VREELLMRVADGNEMGASRLGLRFHEVVERRVIEVAGRPSRQREELGLPWKSLARSWEVELNRKR
jgi:hypothetical protein